MRAGFSDETQRLRATFFPECLFREDVRVASHGPQATEARPRPTCGSTALGSTKRRE
jgi:hypothetical protein